jgi:PAS domain S-box-containing protein
MVESLYLPVLLVAAVVGMAVAFAAWIRGDRAGARPLTVFVAAASFWAVAEGVGVAASGLGALQFWRQVGLSLSVVIPLAWLVTVIEYTGSERWLTRRNLLLLLVEPVVFLGLVWTNGSHQFVWTDTSRAFVGPYSSLVMDFGIGFWGHQVYSHLLVAAGALLLMRVIARNKDLYRSQSTALLVAIVLPLTGNALYMFRIVPAGIDPTAMGYVLGGVVLAFALFRTQLLQVAPAIRELGREELLADLDDAVLIVDENGRIVDTNPAGEHLVGRDRSESLGRELGDLCPDLADVLSSDARQTQVRVDFDGTVRYYDMRVSELDRRYAPHSGRVVTFRDVTDQRRREQRLDVLNRILRHNIRNELNVVRGNVALARAETKEDGVGVRLDAAVETVDQIIDRSNKVNTLSRLFEAETDGMLDLREHLESTLAKVRRDHPDASITIDLPETIAVDAGPSLTAVFDELVRNAIVHNDGDHPDVVVTVNDAESDDNEVVVDVRDDGPGIDEQELRVLREGRETPLDHGSGVGLWLANWVVERNGGTLTFENTADGCTASVELPRAGSDQQGGMEASGVREIRAVSGSNEQDAERLSADRSTGEGTPDGNVR